MEQQLVRHRRQGEGEENNVEEDAQLVPCWWRLKLGMSTGKAHCFPSIDWSCHQQGQHSILYYTGITSI